MQNKKSEISVGAFLLLAIISAIFICLKVANVTSINSNPTWLLKAQFDNIGGLKVQSPVKIGGVVIGRVSRIVLDENTLTPTVEMQIDQHYDNKIPDSSSLAIRTQGLLGEQFLAVNLGFSDADLGTTMLHGGDTITDTKSALVLEDLIGQFLYKNGDSKQQDGSAAK